MYRKKENKFVKNYDYFMSMRNKELGLIEPPVIEDEPEEEYMQENQQSG